MTLELATRGEGRARRHFMRHPATIPITCLCHGHSNAEAGRLRDAGLDGLSFASVDLFAKGDIVNLSFPTTKITELFSGVVVWRQKRGGDGLGRHTYGVRFRAMERLPRVRMLEQICHIEAYRELQAAQRGRHLSSNQAAAEWIAKYASRFPCSQRKKRMGALAV